MYGGDCVTSPECTISSVSVLTLIKCAFSAKETQCYARNKAFIVTGCRCPSPPGLFQINHFQSKPQLLCSFFLSFLKVQCVRSGGVKEYSRTRIEYV